MVGDEITGVPIYREEKDDQEEITYMVLGHRCQHQSITQSDVITDGLRLFSPTQVNYWATSSACQDASSLVLDDESSTLHINMRVSSQTNSTA
jgi:hypothetical protein